jgi:surface protein
MSVLSTFNSASVNGFKSLKSTILPAPPFVSVPYSVVVDTSKIPNTNTDKKIYVTAEIKNMGNVTVDWGDGTIETRTSQIVFGYDTDIVWNHTYSVKKQYTIQISSSTGYLWAQVGNNVRPGRGFGFSALEDLAMIAVTSWGNHKFHTMTNMFCRNANFNSIPTTVPDLSECTSLTFLFDYATIFNQSINDWNITNIKSLNNIFPNSSFNQPLDKWDTSNVTDMSGLFVACPFNQPLNSWNTSKVTTMWFMFYAASSFNQPLDKWNTSNVISMGFMFCAASSFNQPLDKWDISNVTDIRSMFANAAAFNQPLNSWNTSKVTNISNIFRGDVLFNQPLNNWNTANVTVADNAFNGATSFNQPLNSWNTSKIQYMGAMFADAAAFNQPLNNWNTSNVIDMNNMFLATLKYDQNISNWNVTKVGANHINFDTNTPVTWTAAEKPQWVA